MADLLTMLACFFAAANKYLPVLNGGLNVLNSALTFLLKLHELWEKYQQRRQQQRENKRSTKRTSIKNP